MATWQKITINEQLAKSQNIPSPSQVHILEEIISF